VVIENPNVLTDANAPNTAIVYTVGATHYLYINVSKEEAARRWEETRTTRHQFLVEQEAKHEVVRTVFKFKDEIMIWGNAKDDLDDFVNWLLPR